MPNSPIPPNMQYSDCASATYQLAPNPGKIFVRLRTKTSIAYYSTARVLRARDAPGVNRSCSTVEKIPLRPQVLVGCNHSWEDPRREDAGRPMISSHHNQNDRPATHFTFSFQEGLHQEMPLTMQCTGLSTDSTHNFSISDPKLIPLGNSYVSPLYHVGILLRLNPKREAIGGRVWY